MTSHCVLVTGFGPYPEVDWNPSAALVGELAATSGHLFEDAGLRLATAVLPVEYDTVGPALAHAVQEAQAETILLTGLRPSGQCVNLERVALNLDDAGKPDNAGAYRDGQPIDPDGPPAFISPLPLGRMCSIFGDAGVPAEVSNHAGAYICNRCYYLAQLQGRRESKGLESLFVHLPWVGKPGINRHDGGPLEISDLVSPLARLAIELAGEDQARRR